MTVDRLFSMSISYKGQWHSWIVINFISYVFDFTCVHMSFLQITGGGRQTPCYLGKTILQRLQQMALVDQFIVTVDRMFVRWVATFALVGVSWWKRNKIDISARTIQLITNLHWSIWGPAGRYREHIQDRDTSVWMACDGNNEQQK